MRWLLLAVALLVLLGLGGLWLYEQDRDRAIRSELGDPKSLLKQ